MLSGYDIDLKYKVKYGKKIDQRVVGVWGLKVVRIRIR